MTDDFLCMCFRFVRPEYCKSRVQTDMAFKCMKVNKLPLQWKTDETKQMFCLCKVSEAQTFKTPPSRVEKGVVSSN